MEPFATVGVVGKRSDPRIGATLARLLALLRTHQREVWVETQTAALLPADVPPHTVPIASRDELGLRCQLIIVVGGDGTLLAAGRGFAEYGVPILGVNLGRLGFLVDVNPDELDAALQAVFRGEGVRETRPLLEAGIRRADGSGTLPMLAVNDVVLRNQASIRMLEFESWLDDEFIGAHRADGFIVATPTGSTAYALSCGGPVMHPQLEAIALVPICPHTLSDRPVVVGADRKIRIVLRGDAGGATMSCDGQTHLGLNSGDAIEVQRSRLSLRLIHPQQYHYFDMMRSKMHWGRGPAFPG